MAPLYLYYKDIVEILRSMMVDMRLLGMRLEVESGARLLQH